MDRNSNQYTYIFALVMVVVVAALLSGASIALKDMQEANVRQEKQQNILKSIGIELTREESAAQFDNYIVEQLVIQNGQVVQSETPAFEIKMEEAVDESPEDRQVPLYIASIEGESYYVVPLRGKGLWGPIWGYVSLKEDGSTIFGTTFDHKGETPGLGAEISKDFFTNQFGGKEIMDGGEFVSIEVKKGTASGAHEVDGISGGTITSVGVQDMLADCLKPYVGYFESKNRATALNEQ
ncbi:NADH:ubiquinone reductase (Na(+)-transporting) subunit C [Phaeocystidibacter luteus]|uniref:Na(+)-translocating NADH-quinone reductase subunit C n=1 Tax=Phaeocystidibacter luteus TaxID=911197 RepID=A0A6N6RKJ3_9FLAO|nr:NADH:ubiquinone reductase (Na(+)-transporting) subunit C [Phaeocystidibacter luteus]KAB2807333.1 NADH:ubiquinone reductase (Na(+)-transporting) subunit C [Phaeocystidibacter luteus]